MLQPPHWLGFEVMSTSQPLAGLPSQSPNPALQAAISQTRLVHAAIAFGKEHAVLHAPQCVGSLPRFTHMPLQSVCPGGQTATQWFPEQT